MKCQIIQKMRPFAPLILDQIVTAYSLETIELNDKLFMVNGVIQSNKIHKSTKKCSWIRDVSSLKARF
ncbi:MAG: hypothetical protein IPL69_01450 [Saprospiraceae bacterium]|nr:hypothetical protein [Candidatus Brachybacter algidus]